MAVAKIDWTSLKTALSEFTSVHTLQFDVRDKEAVFAQISSLPNDFSEIDILINNAGKCTRIGSYSNWKS